MTRSIADVKRLVVKIGSLLLVDPVSDRLRTDWLGALAEDVARCRARGQGRGRGLVGCDRSGPQPDRIVPPVPCDSRTARPRPRPDRSDWPTLIRRRSPSTRFAWRRFWSLSATPRSGAAISTPATPSTGASARRRPVINENDTVATSEIRFGDNDRLAARVAQMVDAECLVLLSDIDGLYTADPGTDASAMLIPRWRRSAPKSRPAPGELRRGYSYPASWQSPPALVSTLFSC